MKICPLCKGKCVHDHSFKYRSGGSPWRPSYGITWYVYDLSGQVTGPVATFADRDDAEFFAGLKWGRALPDHIVISPRRLH